VAHKDVADGEIPVAADRVVMIDGEVGELISDIVQGLNTKMNLFENAFASGIRVTIPPYPIEPKSSRAIQKHSPNKGIPIRGYEGNENNCYFYEIEEKDEVLIHSDGTGVIAVISDYWDTPTGSLELPYEILDNMKIPDKQYRTDLRDVLPQMYEDVKEVLEDVWA